MDHTLDEIERRVLGVLMEKEMAQPEYYPMTLNAVTAACNQKHNRDPVMTLDEVGVEAALAELQKRGLVTLMYPAQSSRVKRFRHEAQKVYNWQKPERAIMTELLLRGPQTLGELNSHCARFIHFADLEAISALLDSLAKLDPPLAMMMPREPGKSANRYRHTFYSDADPGAPGPAGSETGPAMTSQAGDSSPLKVELEQLRAEVCSLRQELSATQDRLRRIETHLGLVRPSA